MRHLRNLMAYIFAGLFFSVAGILMVLTCYQFFAAVAAGTQIASALLQTVNTAVVALATFELAIGITREYRSDAADGNIFANVRRTATRFIGVVCIALILEALMLVIKYSQLELAGNLYYPVAIIVGASVLLVALGLFLKLTRADSVQFASADTARLRPEDEPGVRALRQSCPKTRRNMAWINSQSRAAARLS